jgi:hypothetical protein
MRRAISPSQAWRSPFHPSCLPLSMRVAIACRTSFRPNNESSRCPGKRLPQRSHQSHRWNRYRPLYASATAAIAHPLWRGCPLIAVGQAFLNQLGQAGITRESVTSVRFPYRQSSAAPTLDEPLRRSDHAAPLQSACWSCARHPFVPAKSRSAAPRNNGRREAGALLRASLQDPSHGTRFAVGAMFRVSREIEHSRTIPHSRPTHCVAPSEVYRARGNGPTPCSQTQSTR